VKKTLLTIALALASAAGFAQQSATARQSKSPTAQRMAKQGMVDIRDMDSTIQVSLMYSRADNFTGKVLYTDLREAYFHPKAATAVAKAQQALRKLRPDLSLKIYDATRPMSVQQKMWNTVAGTKKSIYVSNPRNGGGMHNYGLAVDITLCKAETGDTLDMGTKVDFLGTYAHIDDEAGLVARHIITPQAKKNRELLRRVMTEAGFKPLKTEWWHFNLVSRAEAKAHYKAIK
jgi:D-alanyl-D-alanine dipeptidase